jgi:malonyl-CoA/methylmalonyl-CoA synthetase
VPETVSDIELVRRAGRFGRATAIVSGPVSRSYAELLGVSARIATVLLGGVPDLREGRVALLAPAGFEYAAAQWGIWRAGGIAVPLAVSATEPEIEYVLGDSAVAVALAPRRLADRIAPTCRRLGARLLAVEEADAVEPASLPAVPAQRRAMILYTSGTTSRPKGVVTSHAQIEAQIRCLVEAWGWRADDRIPLFLPLHHVHGIVNVLACALWSGASVEAFESFDMQAVLARVAERAYTLFMAVPTIYVKLIEALESATPPARQAFAAGFASMRLMVSGSAALPASVHERWTELTGQRLLERYGMTEIGMGISNPLHGERRPGSVGRPLPGVQVRLVSEAGERIEAEAEPGEIQVRGPGVFTEYWDRPEATRDAFVDGWFRTGDVAVLEDGYYRILGRLSVDIIKSGGYKLSALEIEDALRQHPAIRECSVVGVPDATWGEAVAAAIVTRGGARLDLPALRAWAAARLSGYKIPRRLLVVGELPRNSMGKVVKPAVKELFAGARP